MKGTVLKIDWPFRARGFLSLTALRAEGCGIALRAMSIKSALRIYLSASFGMMSILLIGRGVSLLSRFAGKGKRRSDT